MLLRKETGLKEKLRIVLFLFLVCSLTACNPDKEAEKQIEIETEECSIEKYEDDEIFTNSHFVYEVRDYGEEEDEYECTLFQKSKEGKVIQRIPFDQLALLSSWGDYVEVLGVTDSEIILMDEDDNDNGKVALSFRENLCTFL